MSKLVTIATFETPEQAHVVRMRLEAEGVAAMLDNQDVVGMFGALSGAYGGVKVKVNAADVERAVGILEGLEVTPPVAADRNPTDSDDPGESWICAQCGQLNEPGFEVCFSCGASIDGEQDPTFEPDEEANPDQQRDLDGSASDRLEAEPVDDFAPNRAPDAPLPGLGENDQVNPYQVTSEGAEPGAAEPPARSASEKEEAQIRRAWQAAVFGVVFCPGLLHVYSWWLLTNIDVSLAQLSPAGRRNYLCAAVLDLAVVLFAIMAWWTMLL